VRGYLGRWRGLSAVPAWPIGWSPVPYIYASSPLGRMSASAAAGVLASEAEYASEPAVSVLHEGSGKWPTGFLKVSLVEGDQGNDVDDRVLGQA
jgi:hypothetical protein